MANRAQGILKILEAEGPYTQKELAFRLGVRSCDVSGSLGFYKARGDVHMDGMKWFYGPRPAKPYPGPPTGKHIKVGFF